MPKKSKPKQRTNWKQRALHCEAVIAIHSQLEKISAEKRREYLQRAEAAERQTDLEVKLRDEYWNRALAAEKQNALLLEEREAKAANRTVCSGCHLPYCHGECFTPVRFYGDKKLFEIGDVVETPEGTFTIGDPANPPKVQPAPTHWQRFKSFLKHWNVELLCLIVILCVTAGCVAYVYWPR